VNFSGEPAFVLPEMVRRTVKWDASAAADAAPMNVTICDSGAIPKEELRRNGVA
jgi:hypothetical protein